jgi:hypothetical protein
MKQPVVVVGVGEMGRVLARSFLRLGYPAYPVTRAVSMAATAEKLPHPELVLVAIAERGDLFAAMVEAFKGDPSYKCMGRSPPARLARALAQGKQHGLDLPALHELCRALV